jgi:hypothetical protein
MDLVIQSNAIPFNSMCFYNNNNNNNNNKFEFPYYSTWDCQPINTLLSRSFNRLYASRLCGLLIKNTVMRIQISLKSVGCIKRVYKYKRLNEALFHGYVHGSGGFMYKYN